MKVSHSDVVILLGLLGEKCRYQTQTCNGYLYRVGEVKIYLKHTLIGCDPFSETAVVTRWEALDQGGELSSYDYHLDLPAYEKGLEPLHIQTNKLNLEGLYLILELYFQIENIKRSASL